MLFFQGLNLTMKWWSDCSSLLDVGTKCQAHTTLRQMLSTLKQNLFARKYVIHFLLCNGLNEYDYQMFTGMVERCHCTIESVMKKVTQRQEDLCLMLESVLFGMRSQVHASTGFTPLCMLYIKYPVMPFQAADKLKYFNKMDSISTSNDETCKITSAMNGELTEMVKL